jgi:hypothetical protein
MTASVGPADLLVVRILGFPLDVFERTRTHMEELTREFEFIAEASGEHETPARLLQLVEALGHRFSGLNDDVENEIEAALRRGEAAIDLTYRVPHAAGDAARQLSDMLDEADDFCRRGDLLTLAATPEEVAFRRWFLDEFARQLDGGAPSPWDAAS